MPSSQTTWALSTGVPAVDDALEFAWLIDIGQGHLEAARQAADAAVEAAPHNNDARFARAAVDYVAGHAGVADVALEQLWKATPSTARVAALGFANAVVNGLDVTRKEAWESRTTRREVTSEDDFVCETLFEFGARLHVSHETLRQFGKRPSLNHVALALDVFGELRAPEPLRMASVVAMGRLLLEAHAAGGEDVVQGLVDLEMPRWTAHALDLQATRLRIAAGLSPLESWGESLRPDLPPEFLRVLVSEGARGNLDDRATFDALDQALETATNHLREQGLWRAAARCATRRSMLHVLGGQDGNALVLSQTGQEFASHVGDDSIAARAIAISFCAVALGDAPHAMVAQSAARALADWNASLPPRFVAGILTQWLAVAAGFLGRSHVNATLRLTRMVDEIAKALPRGTVFPVRAAMLRASAYNGLGALAQEAAALAEARTALAVVESVGQPVPGYRLQIVEMGLPLSLNEGAPLEALDAVVEDIEALLEAPSDLLSLEEASTYLRTAAAAADAATRWWVSDDATLRPGLERRHAPLEAAAAAGHAAWQATLANHRLRAHRALVLALKDQRAAAQARDRFEFGLADALWNQAISHLQPCNDGAWWIARLEADRGRHAESLEAVRAYIDADYPARFRLLDIMARELDHESGSDARNIQLGFLLAEIGQPARQELEAFLDRLGGLETFDDDAEISMVDTNTWIQRGVIAASVDADALAQRCFERADSTITARMLGARSPTQRRRLARLPLLRWAYAEHALFHANRGSWERALEVAEAGRSSALVETVRELEGTLDPEIVALRQAHERALAELQRLQALQYRHPDQVSDDVIAAAHQAADDTESSLLDRAPRLHRTLLGLGQSAPLPLASIRARLLPKEAILASLWWGEELYVWCVTPEGCKGHRHSLSSALVTRPGHARTWLRWYSSAQHRRLDRKTRRIWARHLPADTVQALSALLIAPFSKILAETEHIIFVPDVPLTLTPLGALAWPNPNATVSLLPSLRLLEMRETSVPARANMQTVVVGDPQRMCAPLQADVLRPLPATRLEAAAVGAIWSNGSPLVGGAATRDAVMDRLEGCHDSPTIIHLGAHAIVDEALPLETAVLLANGDVLRVADVAGTRLHDALVVLSACETLRGTGRGADVVGLVHSLLAAGARTVVASQWLVEDVATALFMRGFHRTLSMGAEVSTAVATAASALRTCSATKALEELATMLPTSTPRESVDAAALHQCRATIYQRARDWEAAISELDAARTLLQDARERVRAEYVTQHITRLEAWRAGQSEQPADMDAPVFAESRFWAAFVVCGDGRWRIDAAPNQDA